MKPMRAESRIHRSGRGWIVGIAAALLGLGAAPAAGGPWPGSSKEPVAPLDHAALETRIAATGVDPDSGFKFVAFGDQRALADGESQRLMERVGDLARNDPRILLMIDTGDIVDDGRHSDQFRMLSDILAPTALLPYWPAVGNHELHGGDPQARANTALFLSPIDPSLSPDTLYYAKDVGRVRFLFLDSNLWVEENGSDPGSLVPSPDSPAAAELRWLERTLAGDRRGPGAITVVTLHHPFVQSSDTHREEAARLWNDADRGKTLPDILLDGGVDLVLVGHTHTTERFRLRRDDGKELVLVNLSGRPTGGFLIFGHGRSARDIRGREREELANWGWKGLDRWSVTQEAPMPDNDEADQVGVFTVEPGGGMLLRVGFLADDAPGGLRWSDPARIR